MVCCGELKHRRGRGQQRFQGDKRRQQRYHRRASGRQPNHLAILLSDDNLVGDGLDLVNEVAAAVNCEDNAAAAEDDVTQGDTGDINAQLDQLLQEKQLEL